MSYQSEAYFGTGTKLTVLGKIQKNNDIKFTVGWFNKYEFFHHIVLNRPQIIQKLFGNV